MAAPNVFYADDALASGRPHTQDDFFKQGTFNQQNFADSDPELLENSAKKSSNSKFRGNLIGGNDTGDVDVREDLFMYSDRVSGRVSNRPDSLEKGISKMNNYSNPTNYDNPTNFDPGMQSANYQKDTPPRDDDNYKGSQEADPVNNQPPRAPSTQSVPNINRHPTPNLYSYNPQENPPIPITDPHSPTSPGRSYPKSHQNFSPNQDPPRSNPPIPSQSAKGDQIEYNSGNTESQDQSE